MMDVATLKSKIKTNTIPNFLIFAGDEWKVQEIYIKQIARVTDKPIVRIDSVSEIFCSIQSKSLVRKKFLYIVRDDKELMQNERLQDRLSKVLGDNTLILLLSSVDKRTKFYKRFNVSIIVFERLSDSMLQKYARKEIMLSERITERLIAICENDYGRMLLEIDKIKRYANATAINKDDINYDAYFNRLVNDGTIYQPPKDAIFDFVDAVLDRKINLAFNLLAQSYAIGEATMVLLSVLYNNAKAVFQVQTCESNDISKSTGLTGWQIMNAKKHLNKYSDSELEYLMRKIQFVEEGIKKGIIEDDSAVKYVLVSCM